MRLLTEHCCLCASPLEQSARMICPPCLTGLPWIAAACHRCGLPVNLHDDESGLCGACQTTPPHVDSTFSPLHYQSPVDYIVKQLKFNHQLMLAELMGNLLAREIKTRQLELPDALLPVPLHVSRIRKRGFNQAMEMTRPLRAMLRLPVITREVERIKNTQTQTELTAEQRKKNLRHSFRCSDAFPPPDMLPYRHIAIVDDVITTGATINEIAALLKKHGVQKVSAWSFARA